MRTKLLCGLIAAVLTLPAMADKPAFSVNGQAVSQARVDAMVQQLQQQGQQDSPQLRAMVRDQLVLTELLRQEAQKKGLDKSAEYKSEMDAYAARLLANFYVRDWMRANPVSDAQLRAEYDKLVAQLARKEYSARHILVENEADARKILEDLKKGKAFTAIAKEVSKDTGSKDKGGELGWAPAEAYVKEFSEALTKLTPGQVTANPVKTQFGWHIIQLVDARTQQGPSFDELKPLLAQRIQGAQLDGLLSKLKQQAKVE